MPLLMTNVAVQLENLHKQAEKPLLIHNEVQQSGYT